MYTVLLQKKHWLVWWTISKWMNQKLRGKKERRQWVSFEMVSQQEMTELWQSCYKKSGGEAMIDWLWELLQMVSRTKEVPSEWKSATLVRTTYQEERQEGL